MQEISIGSSMSQGIHGPPVQLSRHGNAREDMARNRHPLPLL